MGQDRRLEKRMKEWNGLDWACREGRTEGYYDIKGKRVRVRARDLIET